MDFQEKETFINTAEKGRGGEFNEVHIQSRIPGREYGSQHYQDSAAAITTNAVIAWISIMIFKGAPRVPYFLIRILFHASILETCNEVLKFS